MNTRPMVLLASLALLAGCESNIRPMHPIERVEVWVPDETSAATAPASTLAQTAPTTEASTAPATQAATAATQPGHVEVKIVDPNETARFIYKATYDNVWQQAIALLNRTGFSLDRQDYRLGVLTTQPLPGAQIVEFWKPQQTGAKNALENTLNSQRRTARVTISKVPGKPDFYEIGVQVLVERETNPSEEIGGPIFVEGSGFGRNAITLRSDYAGAATAASRRWVILGHDPDLEKKLIDALFQHI